MCPWLASLFLGNTAYLAVCLGPAVLRAAHTTYRAVCAGLGALFLGNTAYWAVPWSTGIRIAERFLVEAAVVGALHTAFIARTHRVEGAVATLGAALPEVV